MLRRLRKEGNLPPRHPLVDLCNAVSVATTIPIAVFDLAHVAGNLQVRHATGERPDAGEVTFADEQCHVHARRWCNRQSALSAIRPATAQVLIVAEAMHDTASHDVPELLGELRSLRVRGCAVRCQRRTRLRSKARGRLVRAPGGGGCTQKNRDQQLSDPDDRAGLRSPRDQPGGGVPVAAWITRHGRACRC